MTAIAPPAAPLPPTTTAQASTAPAAPAAPLGATALPATGPTQDAMLGALRQLVTVLGALVEALKGAAATGAGPVATGGGPDSKGGGPTPVQTPIQAPIQAPVQAGGATVATPAVQGGGAVTTLQAAPDGFRGPTIGAQPSTNGFDSVAFSSGPASFEQLGGLSSVQFIERRPEAATPLSASVSMPGGTTAHVSLPASGSVALTSGATVSWSNGAEIGFSIARTGQAAVTFDSASVDRVPGFLDKVQSPLSGAEIAELARAFAARYPSTL